MLLGRSTDLLGQDDSVRGDTDVSAAVGPEVSFVQQYCVDCHGGDEPKAGLSLDDVSANIQSKDEANRVVKVLNQLEFGAMPPIDYPQPTRAEKDRVIGHLRDELVARIQALADTSSTTSEPLSESPSASPPGPTHTRRLSNFEYENTMRDLLGINLQLKKYLPEDPSKPYRANQTADYLRMTGERLLRYQENAKRAMDAVIVEPEIPEIHRARREWIPDKHPTKLAIEGNRRGSPADGLSVKSWPVHGNYRIQVKAVGDFPEDEKDPSENEDLPLRLVMGYALAGDIGAAPFAPVGTTYLRRSETEPKVYEFIGRIENHPSEPERQYRRGGTRTGNLVTIPESMVITPQNLFDDGTLNDGIPADQRPTAMIEWIEFESPWFDTWPPNHHRQILFDSPLRETNPTAYLEQVLARFLRRAFRRPVSDEEINRYIQIHAIHSKGSDSEEQAIRRTLAVALASPQFLYHLTSPDNAYRQFEIANRLSYFLWGSMPDRTLFDLAEAEQLDDPKVIREQVGRMIADPRSGQFVSHLAKQWFALEKCLSIPINSKRFPRFLHRVQRGQHAGEEVPFVPTIREDMVRETIALLAELMDKNLSFFELLDCDFAMLNQRLAAHYGVPGVFSHEIQRVDLAEASHLGGVLSHGSILIGNSNGTVPHPVYRAVWLREAILGEEVRDPPADVPSIEENPKDAKNQSLTFAERLRLHRTETSCRECHAWLDPWGLPFEQHNAVGRFEPKQPSWNTRVRGFDGKKDKTLEAYRDYLAEISTEPVSATSTLPDGTVLNNLEDLKRYLINEKADQVATAVVRRLLSYAIGRELEADDYFAVQSLTQAAKANGYRFQDLIVSICQSSIFRNEVPR